MHDYLFLIYDDACFYFTYCMRIAGLCNNGSQIHFVLAINCYKKIKMMEKNEVKFGLKKDSFKNTVPSGDKDQDTSLKTASPIHSKENESDNLAMSDDIQNKVDGEKNYCSPIAPR